MSSGNKKCMNEWREDLYSVLIYEKLIRKKIIKSFDLNEFPKRDTRLSRF